jgi:hypothetical protein
MDNLLLHAPHPFVVLLDAPHHVRARIVSRVGDSGPVTEHLCCMCCDEDPLLTCAQALWDAGAAPEAAFEIWWCSGGDAGEPERTIRATLCTVIPQALDVARRLRRARRRRREVRFG